MKEPTIACECKIQIEIEKALEEVEKKFKINVDYTWDFEDIHKKCLEIIKQKEVLNYDEIYKFFTYLKEHTDIIAHVYYVEYGLKQQHKYPDITTTMTELIDEMNKHCDYWEAKEGFLTDLTIECSKKNVDADNGFIFWSDWQNGINYFENNEQITKHIIRWLKNTDFDLDDHIAIKLYEILTRGE